MQKAKQTSQGYKKLIMDRISSQTPAQNKKAKNLNNTLKTQCTPNDQTQDFSERMIDDFESNFKVQYRAVKEKQEKKPLIRCIYSEMIALSKGSKPTNVSWKKSRERSITSGVQKTVFSDIITNQAKDGNESRPNLKSSKSKNKEINIQQKNKTLSKQASMKSLHENKAHELKKSSSNQNFKDPKTKRCETLGTSSFRYSSKDLKSLVRKIKEK